MSSAGPSLKAASSPPTAAPPKLARLPNTHRITKRPLLHPPVSSPYTGSKTPKVIYIRANTPFIATVKRARKFLEHIEKRRGGTIQLSKYNNGKKGDKGDIALKRELDNMVSGRGKGGKDGEAEEVIIKGTGKAVQRVLQLAAYFQGQGDLLVRIRTGSVGAVDDIVRRGEEREGEKEEGEMEDGEVDVDLPESRIRRTGCLELGISLR